MKNGETLRIKRILSLSLSALVVISFNACGGTHDQKLRGGGGSDGGPKHVPNCPGGWTLNGDTGKCESPPPQQLPPLVMRECCMRETDIVTGPGVIGNTPLARCYTFPDVTRASDNSLNCGDGLFAAEGCSDC